MVRWKRLFYYLAINVLVSACTVLAVLSLWERYRPAVSFELPWQASTHVSPQAANIELQGEAVLTPDPTPTRALATYRVKQGDTFGEIAEQFEISVEELLELNPGVMDPDALGSGQVLFVPAVSSSDPIVPPSSEEVDEPSTPEPPETDQEGEIAVVISTVIGAGDLDTERVRLEYKGDSEISLFGWQLVDESGSAFIFPHLSLYKGGGVFVYTKTGVDSVAALYWGLENPVWNSGETITLVDQFGAVRSTYITP